jgi:hypothetical protein
VLEFTTTGVGSGVLIERISFFLSLNLGEA